MKKIAQEEAFLLPEVTQQIYDLMTVNLNVEPEYIVDKIAWHRDTPFRDIIDAIVREYRTARNLHPLRIIVLGPPASGKSVVARYLADYYGVHYIHAQSLIEETVRKLVGSAYRVYSVIPRFRIRERNSLTVKRTPRIVSIVPVAGPCRSFNPTGFRKYSVASRDIFARRGRGKINSNIRP